MADNQPLQDFALGNLNRSALDHHDGLGRARDDDVHVGVLQLTEGRVHHPVALDPADADRRDGRVKGNHRGVQRHRGPDEGEHIRVVFLIGAEYLCVNLGLVEEPVGEEGTQRAIRQSRRKHFLLLRSPFPLEETAGDLAGGIGLFPVLHREGEEREVGGFVLYRRGNEHDGLSKLNKAGPVREAGHPANLEDESPAGEFAFDSLCHFFFRNCRWNPAAGVDGSTAEESRHGGRIDSRRSMAQSEVFDQLPVSFDVGALQVFKEAPSAAYHLEQAAATVVVVFVGVEVTTKMVDPGRQKSDLHRCAAGAVLMRLVLLYDLLLIDAHSVSVSLCLPGGRRRVSGRLQPGQPPPHTGIAAQNGGAVMGQP